MDKLHSFGASLAEFARQPGPPLPPFYTTAAMNWMGCALAGARQSAVDRAVAYLATQGQTGLRPPIGRTEPLSAQATVLVDCLSSASLAYDDIHFETTLHPAGPVAAAIFGLARSEKIAGTQALEAFRIGMEVECRVALALFAGKARGARGWYATGITGGIGAAAAVGRLMGLGQEQMESALGLAAAKAAGTRGTHGSMAAHIVPGLAAESGFAAAGLARAGLTCGMDALTGANGLLRLIAGEPDLSPGSDGLGDRYVCETTACKPFPFGFIAHATIQCCLDAGEALRGGARSLASAEIRVSPTAAALGGKPTPASVFEAHVALRYIAARVLVDPALAFVPLEDNFSIRRDIAEMAEKIRISADPALADAQALCSLTFSDGGMVQIRCDRAPGSPGNPPRAEETKAKFLRLVSPILGADRAAGWQRALAAMPGCPDIAQLLDF